MWSQELPLLLVPFALTQAAYWHWNIPESEPSLFALCLKCLPVTSLAVYVATRKWPPVEENTLPKRVLFGLLFSLLGDALLIYEKQLFLAGVAAFGLAQAFYSAAFGWNELKLRLLPPLLLYGGGLLSPVILRVEDPVVQLALPLYGLLVVTMAWRATARAKTPASILTAVGTVVFIFSDAVIVWNKFRSPVPYAKEIIMATYYLAQLLITFSVMEAVIVDSSSKKKKKK